jgi:hypothetical protein
MVFSLVPTSSSSSWISFDSYSTCKSFSTISVDKCHTRVSGHQDLGANIITRCAGTKSHTYDESWHRIECHIFTI